MNVQTKTQLFEDALASVLTEFGDIPDPVEVNDYEEKQAARAARYEARADRLAKESDDAATRSRNLLPSCGSPILVGHHSEGRHRRALRKADQLMGKSVSLADKAAYYASRADAVGSGGISSDDPDAARKLLLQLVKAVELQLMMKSINKVVKSKKLSLEEKLGLLKEAGYSDRLLENVATPDFAGRYGIPAYALQNNNQNIRRLKERIQELRAKANLKHRHYSIGVEGSPYYATVEESPSENRVFVRNEEKPIDDVRTIYKRNGFRWSPSQGAWSRQLTASALYAVRSIHADFMRLQNQTEGTTNPIA